MKQNTVVRINDLMNGIWCEFYYFFNFSMGFQCLKIKYLKEE